MGAGAARIGQAVDARRRIGCGRRAGRSHAGGGSQRADRRDAAGRGASLVCYGFVGSLKNRLRLDDSLDVFGIHGLGGITGSIGTAVVALPALGGHGGADYSLGWQLVRQMARSGWRLPGRRRDPPCASQSVKLVMPLRHDRDAEREGLDIADHGERAYNY